VAGAGADAEFCENIGAEEMTSNARAARKRVFRNFISNLFIGINFVLESKLFGEFT
jgi:hypothetical protein